MITRAFACFALIFSLTILNSQSLFIENPEDLKAKADILIQDAIKFKEHVGLSAGIYANEQLLWSNGAGFQDEEQQIPASAQMVHRIASISKPMTAVAILQLVEQGKLDLDVPIQNYVPEFPKKPQGTITTRHLLQHSSGIPHYKSKLDGFSLKEYENLLTAIGRFQGRDLVGTPGEVYKYTTYGYVVLGVIIEKVSGLSYENYMRKHVWEPAGMLHTSVEKKNVAVANKSKLYRGTDKGKVKKDLNTNLSMKVPGGGLQSTAEDLLRFGEAILNNTLLKAETLELMLEDPGIRPKEAGNPYAMGWFLYSKEEGNRIIGHSGAQAGTSTQLMILLDQKAVVAVISNTRGQWGRVFNMSWQMIELIRSPEARVKPAQKTISISIAAMDRLTGQYDFGKGQLLTISRKGKQLYSKLNKYPPLKLFPETEQKLYYRDANAYFEFELEGDEIVKTIYVQNGKRMEPKKIK